MSDPRAHVDPETTAVPSRKARRGFKQFIRNSPWLVISVGAHVVAFALLGLFYVTKAKPAEEPEPMTIVLRPAEPVELPPDEPPPPTDRRTVPTDNLFQEVTTDDKAVNDDPLDDVAGAPTGPDHGDDYAPKGTPIGTGEVGNHGGERPSPYPGNGTGKTNGGTVGGPTQATEKAVLDGLRWLLRHQNADGSWTTHGFADQCQPNSKCQDVSEHADARFDEGLTGLAILAFLGAGFGPDANQYIVEVNDRTKRYAIGESVKRGLKWLLKRQKPDGSFTDAGPFMYNEAICTLALCEAYGRGKHSRLWQQPAKNALKFLADAQRPSPQDPSKLWGWRYDARRAVKAKQAEFADPDAFMRELCDADASVTGWAAMAFKSAAMADLPVPRDSIDGTLDFARWVAADSGLSGYQRPEEAGRPVAGQFDNYTYHAASMAAVNTCIRAFLAHDPNDEYLRKAADAIVKDLPKSGTGADLDVDYYYWYYATLALNQIDGPDAPKPTGKHWRTWNNAMTKALLGLQDLDPQACSHGGWIVADRWAHEAGPIYSTAINVLTLEVYYRYPNALR